VAAGTPFVGSLSSGGVMRHNEPVKKAGWILFVVCVVAVTMAVVFFVRARHARAARDTEKAQKERPVPVSISTAALKDVPVYVEGLGSVTPLYTVTVKTQVDGRLDSVGFTEGQLVQKGDAIALIDPRPYEIQIQQGNATRAKDEATRRGAEITFNRDAELARQGLQTQQQVDNDRATLDSAAAAVKQDDATIATAALNLDYAHIRSPIEGVTGIRLVDPGNMVHAADVGGIVVLTQLDPIAVVFTLPEDDLPRIAEARLHGTLKAFAFSRDGVTPLGDGDLTVVDNQISVTTATVKLKAVMANAAKKLWPNQFVKTRLLLETKKGVLVIPAAALQHGPKGTFVYVIDDGDKAVESAVAADEIEGDRAIVTSGLKAGDRVVVDGQAQLKPGAKVAIQVNTKKANKDTATAATAAP
jgi:multidrug efflux system membrane fusion protein